MDRSIEGPIEEPGIVPALQARIKTMEETARLNAEEYIKAQADCTRWAMRCGVEKGLKEVAEARVAELEANKENFWKPEFQRMRGALEQIRSYAKGTDNFLYNLADNALNG